MPTFTASRPAGRALGLTAARGTSRRPQVLNPRAASSSSPADTPSGRTVGDRAASAARDFAERHKLKERASAALGKTASALTSAAREADEKLGLSTKARRFTADAARYAPIYRRRIRAFMAGPAGPPFLAVSLALLAYFGLLGRLLNFLLLLWWLAPLVMLPLSAASARRAQAEAEAAAAARRAAGPFGAWGRGARGPSSGGNGSGPVIDVEWEDAVDGR